MLKASNLRAKTATVYTTTKPSTNNKTDCRSIYKSASVLVVLITAIAISLHSTP